MGFIDKVTGNKRREIDRLEARRIDALIGKLRDLGAEVDRNDVRLYSADKYHDKTGVVIETPSMYRCLPDGIREEGVRVPVVLVDGLLFAACEYSKSVRTWSGTSYEPHGPAVFLVRYYPCRMRLAIEDTAPLSSTVDLATRLERIVGKSFPCRHRVWRTEIKHDYNWQDETEAWVDHLHQVTELPPLAKPEDYVDGSRAQKP